MRSPRIWEVVCESIGEAEDGPVIEYDTVAAFTCEAYAVRECAHRVLRTPRRASHTWFVSDRTAWPCALTPVLALRDALKPWPEEGMG